MSDYRKIWESHNGPIPKDSDDRSYEIHHKDGDRSNNDITNLKLVTIQEHYDIHFLQCDWAACQSIAFRMNLSPEEHSKRQSDLARRRINEGSHPFVDPVIRAGIDKKTGVREREKIKAGKSQLFTKKANDKRIKSHNAAVATGTHHTLTVEYAESVRKNQYKLLSEGKHTFQLNRDKQIAAIHGMIDDGTHPLLGSNRIDPNKIPVSCIVCKKETTLPALSSHHKHDDTGRPNPGSTKLCCLGCKKEINKGAFTRWHFKCHKMDD
jgi:hypothetical protein